MTRLEFGTEAWFLDLAHMPDMVDGHDSLDFRVVDETLRQAVAEALEWAADEVCDAKPVDDSIVAIRAQAEKVRSA